MIGLTPLTIKVTLRAPNEENIQRIYIKKKSFSGTLSPHWKVEPAPDLAIDYEKLKIQEKILFFDEVLLKS